MSSDKTYNFDSQSYLKRAREQLDNHTYIGLFYAALELRCGIEARIKEYLESHDHIPNKRKKEWQLSHLNNTILKYFGDLQYITEYTIHITQPIHKKYVFYYTPVTPELINIGQRLGDLLHFQAKDHSSEDEFWRMAREMLEKAYKLLEISNKGILMGPLRGYDGKSLSMILKCSTKEETKSYRDIKRAGKHIRIIINYLDEFPSI